MEKLMSAVNKTKSAGFKDPHEGQYWRAEQDKAGNAFCVIRFLPGKTDDHVPFVKTYSHGFKNSSGRWFIENCPTTIDEKCPVCEGNGPLWNSGNDKDKEIVRERKRKVAYLSNILVISDPKHPENEGKVFLFKYGQKIFDKVVGALTPEFEDEKPMNPFDIKVGANFKLKIRKVEGYANYDKSEFDNVSAVEDSVQVLKQMHDIDVFLTAAEFKTYDALKTKFDLIVGNNGQTSAPSEDQEFIEKQAAKSEKKKEPAKAKAKTEPAEPSGEDDDLAYFARLANEE